MTRNRRIAVWTLIIGATVIAFVATLTVWVQRQVLDNNTWTTTSRQLIEDPQVQQSLSVYLVNQLYANVDVAAALRQRLPPSLDSLAAPISAALREPAANTVALALTRPRIQNLWVQATSTAHQRLVNVLRNETGEGIDTGNGVVTVQLGTLLKRMADELGLPASVAEKVPEDAGTIVIMRSSSLKGAQDAVQGIDVLSRWLLILVLGMYAAAGYIARGERRIAIRRIGWSLVGVGIALLVARKLIGNYVINSLTDPPYRGLGHHVWAIGTAILGEIGWATVLYGLLLVGSMVLAGGTRYARATRRTIAPVLIDHQPVAWGAAGGVLLLLLLWGGTHALRTWWGVVLFAILIAAGLAALRRQVLEEREEPTPRPGTDSTDFDGRKLALR